MNRDLEMVLPCVVIDWFYHVGVSLLNKYQYPISGKQDAAVNTSNQEQEGGYFGGTVENE